MLANSGASDTSMSPWGLLHSPKTSGPADCVGCVLVEFDIDRGSILRLQVPNNIPVATHCVPAPGSSSPSLNASTEGGAPTWAGYFADQLIPDGSEKFDFALIWLVLNRPRPSRRFTQIVSVFEADHSGNWFCKVRWCVLSIEGSVVQLADCEGAHPAASFPVHGLTHHPMPSLPPQFPSPTLRRNHSVDSDIGDGDDRVFVTLLNSDHTAAVLFSSTADFEGFAARLASVQADENSSQALADDPPLFGISCTMTKKDTQVRRGSINKGIAVFSHHIGWLSCIVPLLEVAVDACCMIKGWNEQTETAQRAVLEALYNQLTAVVVPIVTELTEEQTAQGLASLVRHRCLHDDAVRTSKLTVPKQLFYRSVAETSSPATAALASGAEQTVPLQGPDGNNASQGSFGASANVASGDLPLESQPSLDISSSQSQSFSPAEGRQRGTPPANANSIPAGNAHLSVRALPHSPAETYYRVAQAASRVVVELFEVLGLELPRVVLLSALDKRMFILARQVPATKVSNACVAIGAVLSSLDPDVLATRIFPYTAITNTFQFEGRDSYIVGTMNPIFESIKPKRWWDVLVELDKKTFTCGDPELIAFLECAAAPAAEAGRLLWAAVGQFKARGSSDAADLELRCRRILTDMIHAVVRLGVSEETAPALSVFYRSRIGSMLCNEAAVKRGSQASWAEQLSACVTEDANALVSVLQRGLRCATTPNELYRLILSFPDGDVHLVAQLLFHSDPVVVLLAVALLRRIDSDPVGKLCVSRLNNFVLFAFEQLKAEMPDTGT
jgi:hypothetical protein